MSAKFTCFLLLLIFLSLQHSSISKKVIIHVPYPVKNIKHTHTVYKIIPHYHEYETEETDKQGKDFYAE